MPYRRNTRRKHACGRWLLYAVLITLLSGCQPVEPDAALEVGASGSGSAQFSVPSDALAEPPAAADLQLDTSSTTLDTLDLMTLSGCSVQTTIGKRNSSLGRHAKPSQRLLLELEYLRLAPPCIDMLRDRQQGLADVLEAAWHERQAQLPTLVFNATLGSDEFHSFWLAPRAPGDYPVVGLAAAVSALQRINRHVCRWLSGDYRAQNRDLEVLLSQVAGGDAGALMQALHTQSSAVVTVDPAIGRLQTLLTTIKTLEAQLASILPLQYLDWMDDRNDRVTETASTQYRPSLIDLPSSCGIN